MITKPTTKPTPKRFALSQFAPLKAKIDHTLPPPDINKMRQAATLNPSLRD